MSKEIVEERYLYDKYGCPVFRIKIEDPGKYKETSFNAVVEEIYSWSMDNEPKDWEQYLQCHIKWDSCSHFWFGQTDEEGDFYGYLHICGAEYYKRHVDLMNYLYSLAFERMDREPFDDYEVWEKDLKVLKEKP